MTTRIRINAEGQITETRPVNAIKINGQNKTTDQYPNDVIAAQGYLPESPQIKGGWLIPVYADLPEGARVTADTWERVGNEAIQTVTAYKTAEEVATQEQIDRHNQLLAMTDAYGADVAILGKQLAKFVDPETGNPYAIPIDAGKVIAEIKTGLATGTIAAAKIEEAKTLEGLYRGLRQVMTDEDIAAVASVIGGLE